MNERNRLSGTPDLASIKRRAEAELLRLPLWLEQLTDCFDGSWPNQHEVEVFADNIENDGKLLARIKVGDLRNLRAALSAAEAKVRELETALRPAIDALEHAYRGVDSTTADRVRSAILPILRTAAAAMQKEKEG